MKVQHNECLTKSLKMTKKENLNKKEDITIKIKLNKTDFSFSKMKCIKNLKKNINDKFSSIKKENINLKKSFDFKNALKQDNTSKSNSNNKKTIIVKNNRFSEKRIGLIHKSKIVKHKKNKSQNAIYYRNYNSNDNKNNTIKKNIISLKYNSGGNKLVNKNMNKSFNNISNKNQDSKLDKNVNNSLVLSLGKKENKSYINFRDSENNNQKHNYNIDSQSMEKNNIFIEENKENINNFCYETGTKEKDSHENKIILKCDNNSLLTFGNSFSYSNSQKSKSDKKYFNNDANNKDINNNDKNKNSGFFLVGQNNLNNNYNYVNKLKEENETLRKELKESNDQISLLMSQIRELKESKNFKSIKIGKKKVCPPNLWNKKQMNFDDDKENKNIYNIFVDNKINEKINNKKNILKPLNGNKLKVNKIKINQKLNMNNKNFKKKKNDDSICLDKPCEKINECISKIKI